MPADRQQGSGRARGGSGRAGRQGELPTGLNLVVVTGQLGRPAEQRELPSGDRMVSYQVTVPRQGQRAETVPVVWMAAPARAADHDVGARVLVVGRVRRRFFRSGGSLQSRTEVIADLVLPLGQVHRVRQALTQAQAALEAQL